MAPELLTAIEGNQLGYGITVGGVYRELPLKLAAVEWATYGPSTQVRSGWLYVPQLTASHAIAFFKIHISDGGAGYIHIVDVAHPAHRIWLETQTGFRQEEEFHYAGSPVALWEFTWSETDRRLVPLP